MSEEQQEQFKCWAILELMGHRRLGGFVTTQEIAGAAFIRIDIPGPDDTTVTQFYNPSSLYGLTPTTEDLARTVARSSPAPIERWDLPKAWREAIDNYEAERRRAAITTGVGQQSYVTEPNDGVDDIPF